MALPDLGLTVSMKKTPRTGIFSTKFQKQLDSATIIFRIESETQNFQLSTHESVSIHACRVEGLVNNVRPKYDSKTKNREDLKTFI